MNLTDWLVALHVLSAFSIIAALVVYSFVIAFARNLSVPSEIVRLFRISRVGDVLMAIGMLGVLVFGVWLAIDKSEYAIWDGWIIAALVLWILAGFLGGRVGRIYNGARDRARALVAEGEDAPSPELNALLRSEQGLTLHVVGSFVFLLLLLDMIFKPGA